PLDPLLHLPPLRLGEKVSTYFRMGHAKQKSRMVTNHAAFFPSIADGGPPAAATRVRPASS
ncbi:hypothetical protein JYB32_33405, partial [Burkholderia cenocepacia]|uniref:hypothetical protein n=1 Tax=Burkholderia cenocepacia TaxID=95486 RepID=UPI00196BA106